MGKKQKKSRQKNKPKNKNRSMALRFGPFKVPPVNVFHWSRHTAAIVNLKPIVPGHVLLISR